MSKVIVTLFGSTGDLTLRKLLPALEMLIKEKSHDISIIAIGRKPFTSEDYLNFVSDSHISSADINVLRPHLMYMEMDIRQSTKYKELKALIETLSRNHQQVQKIFYLAVGPDFFMPIGVNLKNNRVITKGDKHSILAFEKPFGRDQEDALSINEYLLSAFSKNQIYRVDHFLGKEMILNILGLRFANSLTSPLLKAPYISEVKIVVSEKDGVLNRGPYYEEVGVLNDMIQNHLLQMLALLIMDKPRSLSASHLAKKKSEALTTIQFEKQHSLLGQYDGYRKEKGVDINSPISTLAFLSFKINKPHFKDIPFYLITGKALANKESYIEIIFKDTRPNDLFVNPLPNKMKIEFYPHSRLNVTLNSVDNFNEGSLKPVVIDYCYDCDNILNVKDPYVIIFGELIAGRQNIFPSFEEVKNSFKVINQIRKDKPRWIIYPQGYDLFKE